MLSDSFQYILNDLIASIFNNDSEYTMIAINAQYLKDDGQTRGGMITYIKAHYPSLVSIVSECKHFFYICKNEIEPLIKEKSIEFYKAIDGMFMKIAYQSLQSYYDSQVTIDYDDNTNSSLIPMPQLPIIPSCSYNNLTNSSVSIVIDEITKEMIFERNKHRIPNVSKRYSNAEVTYRLYLYNSLDNIYVTIDKYKSKNEKITFSINELEDNHCYLFKISVVLNKEYFSSPKRNFYFYTKGNLKRNNALFVYGDNDNGELIDVSSTFYSQFKRMPVDIIDFAFSNLHSLIVLSNGGVVNGGKCWLNKANKDDCLFDIENNVHPDVKLVISQQPFLVEFPIGIYIRKVSLGNEHCVALSNQGQCFSWGANAFGQLGLGIEKSLIVGKPKPISFPSTFTLNRECPSFISDITSGFNHCIAMGVTNNKIEIYYWGYGLGNEPSPLSSYTKSVINCSSSPFKLPFSESNNIVKIYAKHYMSAFIVRSHSGLNSVFTFGTNTNHQLGFINDHLELNMNWEIPTLVSQFTYNNLSVIDISICETYTLFIVRNKLKMTNEIYIVGLCDIIKDTPIKIPEKLLLNEKNIVSACASQKSIYVLYEDGYVELITKAKSDTKVLLIEQYKYKHKHTHNAESVNKMEGTSNSLLIMTNANVI